MSEEGWAGLDVVPPGEVHRRALIAQRLSGAQPAIIGPLSLIGWESGGGDYATWLFAPDGQVLLLVFDHECDLNLYVDDEVDAQIGMYEGLPEMLLGPVRGLPDGKDFLMVGTGEDSVPVASGVFWFDGATWSATRGLRELAQSRGLDLMSDSGFRYCTSVYRFDREFTPEALAADGAEVRWGVSLQRLQEIFTEVGASE